MAKKTYGSVSIEWVTVKEFMRYVFRFNDLNFFLKRLECLPYFKDGLTSLADKSKGSPLDQANLDDAPWRDDPFFPLSPKSDEIFIKVQMHNGEIDLNADYVWKLKRLLGLDMDYMSEEERDVYCKANAYHQTPIWSSWSLLEYWTPEEASFLLFEEEPTPKALETYKMFPYPIHDIAALREVIKRACEAELIKGLAKDNQCSLYVRSLLTWAEKRGFSVPEDLRLQISWDKTEDQTPDSAFGKNQKECGLLHIDDEERSKSNELDISQIVIELETDDQVKITIPGRSARSELIVNMGFKSSTTKEFLVLKRILETGEYIANAGKHRKRVGEVNEKLQEYFGVKDKLISSGPPGSGRYLPVFKTQKIIHMSNFEQRLKKALESNQEDNFIIDLIADGLQSKEISNEIAEELCKEHMGISEQNFPNFSKPKSTLYKE
jgi:hypothetical protein